MRFTKFVGVDDSANAFVVNMLEQINQAGGMLNFSISTNEDGWLAECREFPGIITGGGSAAPSEEEVYRQVKDAVFAAFNIPATIGRRKELVRPTMKSFSLSALCGA